MWNQLNIFILYNSVLFYWFCFSGEPSLIHLFFFHSPHLSLWILPTIPGIIKNIYIRSLSPFLVQISPPKIRISWAIMSFLLLKTNPFSHTWVYANEVTLGRNTSRTWTGHQRNHACDQRAGNFSPLPLWGKKEGWRLSLITNGQWFDQPRLCNTTWIKTLKQWSSGSFWVDEGILMPGGWCILTARG